MIKKLYAWTVSLASHKRALWALGLIAFLEASIFPIPPDILMIPMILVQPKRAFTIASIALFGSVLGGLLGYFIGSTLYEEIGYPIISFFGKEELADQFNRRYNNLGFWPVVIAGLTPIPYKIVTIMSGWASAPIGSFLIASILARGLRFFILAILLWKYGEKIKSFIEKRLSILFILFILALFMGFGLVKLI